MGTGTNTVYKVKRLVPVVAGILAIVLVGFLLGKPLLNMLTGAGKEDSSSQPTDPSSQVEISSKEDTTQSSSDVSSQPQTEDVPVVHKTRVYFYVDTAVLSTDAGIDNVVAQMKNAGATHLVFDVKNPDGTVMYLSSNQYASQLKSDKAVDLKALTARLA